MKYQYRICVTAFACLLFFPILSGCGSKVDVSGKVAFSDGTPLTTGIVYFEKGNTQAFGIIDAEGRYQLGEVKANDGIKPGEYRVRVIAKEGGTSDGAPLVRFVDKKYENTETSDLTCSVTGKTVYDITVDKPKATR